MNIKVEILFLILGGIIRIVGTIASIWYFLTQDFKTDTLYYLCGSSIIAPPVVFCFATITYCILDCCKCNYTKTTYKLGLGIMITFGGPIGVPLFFYAIILSCNQSHTGDFYIIEGISRCTTLIESLFESLPQIAIQVYNNQLVNDWSELKISSIAISAVGVMYASYKLCHAVDKIQHYENASAEQAVSAVSNPTTNRKDDDNFEVYDQSI